MDNKFSDYIDSWSWDGILETGEVSLSKEEESHICSRGYYGKAITRESVDAFLSGKRYPGNYCVTIIACDGTYSQTFMQESTAKKYAFSMLGRDLEMNCSAVNPAGSTIELIENI